MTTLSGQSLDYAVPARRHVSGHALFAFINSVGWIPLYFSLPSVIGPLPAIPELWAPGTEGAVWFSLAMVNQFFGPLSAIVFGISGMVRIWRKPGELRGFWLAMASVPLGIFSYFVAWCCNFVLV
jgi:hypothetical protein